MSRRAFNPFTCPNCGAYYQVVKVEAGPETDNREIKCQVCSSPLAGREGKFVLKYAKVVRLKPIEPDAAKAQEYLERARSTVNNKPSPGNFAPQ